MNTAPHVGLLLGVYSLLIAAASLAGGWIMLSMRLTHARLQVAISFVAGLMLGMALLHFIPHAVHQYRSLDRVMAWTLGGFLVMFFLQRFLPYHHHDVPEESMHQHLDSGGGHHHHEHEHERHPSAGGGSSEEALSPAPKVSWIGTLLGMSLHSLIGGFALGAAVVAEAARHGTVMLGLGTAVVIILHKPFDAGAVSTVTTASGCSTRLRHLVNLAFALVTPLGATLFYLGASRVAHMDPVFLGAALGFCAGTFLCISCADLLPELQFHSHDRLKLSLALIAGLAIAVLIGALEEHEHHSNAGAPSSGSAYAPPGLR